MEQKGYFVGLRKVNTEFNAALEKLLGIELGNAHAITIRLSVDEAASVTTESYLDSQGELLKTLASAPGDFVRIATAGCTNWMYARKDHLDRGMRLYCWRPEGHGRRSVFTVAESEKQATQNVLISQALSGDDELWCGGEPEWPEGYRLEVYEVGQVAVNEND